MSDIIELERRIAAAFDRIDQGLEVLARQKSDLSMAQPIVDAAAEPLPAAEAAPLNPTTDTAPPPAMLLRALEMAKASSADWAERYRALEAQMSAETLAMASEIARLTQALDAAAPSIPPQDNAGTSQNIADRDAEIDELTARIAQQEAELETLRALRSSEAQELGDIIAALEPLVAEAPYV